MAGALIDLVIFLPLLVVVAVLKHSDVATSDAYLWVASADAVFVAPAIGGAAAGRRRPESPLTHGAAAAGLAFVGFLVFRVVDGAVSGRTINAVQAILFLFITVSMGVLGAYIGSRQHRGQRSPA